MKKDDAYINKEVKESSHKKSKKDEEKSKKENHSWVKFLKFLETKRQSLKILLFFKDKYYLFTLIFP